MHQLRSKRILPGQIHKCGNRGRVVHLRYCKDVVVRVFHCQTCKTNYTRMAPDLMSRLDAEKDAPSQQ